MYVLFYNKKSIEKGDKSATAKMLKEQHKILKGQKTGKASWPKQTRQAREQGKALWPWPWA